MKRGQLESSARNSVGGRMDLSGEQLVGQQE